MARQTKRPVPLSAIEQQFEEQLRFLRKSARDYDAGDHSEFKRMALAIRILLHDSRTSHSLAGQLGLKSTAFLSSGYAFQPGNLMSDFCLAVIKMDADGATFEPVLDTLPFPPRPLSFDDWWTETVLKDAGGALMTREMLVTVVANQEGGAHVDSHIEEWYHKLAKEHSIGLASFSSSTGQPLPSPGAGIPLEHIEKVYVRHIAHEVLASLEPAWQRILGNRGCSCGSGRKSRYCCRR